MVQRRAIFGAVLVLTLAAAVPAAARTNPFEANEALRACAAGAKAQNMAADSVIREREIVDARNIVVAREVVMDARGATGMLRLVCTYDIARRTTLIVRSDEAAGKPKPDKPKPDKPKPKPKPPVISDRDLRNGCLLSAQRANILVDRVLRSSDILDRRGDVVARELLLSVFYKARPRQATCTFDAFTRKAEISLRR